MQSDGPNRPPRGRARAGSEYLTLHGPRRGHHPTDRRGSALGVSMGMGLRWPATGPSAWGPGGLVSPLCRRERVGFRAERGRGRAADDRPTLASVSPLPSVGCPQDREVADGRDLHRHRSRRSPLPALHMSVWRRVTGPRPSRGLRGRCGCSTGTWPQSHARRSPEPRPGAHRLPGGE